MQTYVSLMPEFSKVKFHYILKVTACASLFLAGKVEETPKKCRDIIMVAKKMLSEHHFRLFGDNPRVCIEEIIIVYIEQISFKYILIS